MAVIVGAFAVQASLHSCITAQMIIAAMSRSRNLGDR